MRREVFYLRPEVRLGSEPGMCAYKHVLIPGRFSVHFLHCRCPAYRPEWGGHDAWHCRDCQDEGRGDEAWMYPAKHARGGTDWMQRPPDTSLRSP